VSYAEETVEVNLVN